MIAKVIFNFFSVIYFFLWLSHYTFAFSCFLSSVNFVTAFSQQAKMQASLSQQPGGKAVHIFRDPSTIQKLSSWTAGWQAHLTLLGL